MICALIIHSNGVKLICFGLFDNTAKQKSPNLHAGAGKKGRARLENGETIATYSGCGKGSSPGEAK
jgi:hypothetical protein